LIKYALQEMMVSNVPFQSILSSGYEHLRMAKEDGHDAPVSSLAIVIDRSSEGDDPAQKGKYEVGGH